MQFKLVVGIIHRLLCTIQESNIWIELWRPTQLLTYRTSNENNSAHKFYGYVTSILFHKWLNLYLLRSIKKLFGTRIFYIIPWFLGVQGRWHRLKIDFWYPVIYSSNMTPFIKKANNGKYTFTSLSSFRSESLVQEFIKLPPVWDVRFTRIITRQRSYAAKNVLNIPKQPGMQ